MKTTTIRAFAVFLAILAFAPGAFADGRCEYLALRNTCGEICDELSEECADRFGEQVSDEAHLEACETFTVFSRYLNLRFDLRSNNVWSFEDKVCSAGPCAMFDIACILVCRSSYYSCLWHSR